MRFRIPLGAILSCLAVPALAQVPYDPPTASKPPPNVLLLIDGTRTTLIDGKSCSESRCHVEPYQSCDSGLADCNLYKHGETRLQLARRVLTGGWGWNTSGDGAQVADAATNGGGVMDQYRVHWGLAFFDGLGTRFVRDPSSQNLHSQQAIIDFGLPPNDERAMNGLNMADGPDWSLNSWMPPERSTDCCGNYSSGGWTHQNLEWFDHTVDSGGRLSRALQQLADYWEPGVSPDQFVAPTAAAREAFGEPAASPGDGAVIDDDISNVLVTPVGLGGCKRNFTIVVSDGHGGCDYDANGGDGPLSPSAAAKSVRDVRGSYGALGESAKNQVFSIVFGDAGESSPDNNWRLITGRSSACSRTADAAMDGVADYGYDGLLGGGGLERAYDAAPDGTLTDLAPMFAAFSGIFGLVLEGTYAGAPPSVTRLGDRMVRSSFEIRACSGISPDKCNLGRPGALDFIKIFSEGDAAVEADPTKLGEVYNFVEWDAGENLAARLHSDRTLMTAPAAGSKVPSETNCTSWATCSAAQLEQMALPNPASTAEPTAEVADTAFTGSGLTNNSISFLRGDPTSQFAHRVFRGDTAAPYCEDVVSPYGQPDDLECLDDPYKLADIANSRPVIVGAPGGIGEDIHRWTHFTGMSIPRSPIRPSGAPEDQTVMTRDQVIYVGANDGFLHAFLSGKAKSVPRGGVVADYEAVGDCPIDDEGQSPWCDGMELWAYSPGLLQNNWSLLTSGHYFMVDGTPVVSDVLFTKSSATPGALCNRHLEVDCSGWEYRTVLLQCLGAGGAGCFAMDVTNPYNPQLLWERELDGVSGRGTSTSRPQVGRVRRLDDEGNGMPYYVAMMGGGLNEADANGRKGSFIVMGLEDGRVFYSSNTADADFAGAPTCLDTNKDDYVDTCYIVTTDASLYKVRFTHGDPSQGIAMEKFFDGRAAVTSEYLRTDPIRSFARVAATFSQNGNLNLYYGTGNFEDVQDSTEQNYFFKVVDTSPKSAPTAVTAAQNAARVAAACENADDSTFSAADGAGILKLPLGEKIFFDPVISRGTVLFTSFQPNRNACLAGGASLYGIHFEDCSDGLDTDDDGYPDDDMVELDDGLPSQPVVNEETGTIYVSADDGTIDTGGGRRPPGNATPMLKLWWRDVLP